MVQPLSLNAEPFCLQLFGTDNQFNFADVVNRQRFMRTELKKHGIDVLGMSADGDPKLLKAKKVLSGLGACILRTFFEVVRLDLLFVSMCNCSISRSIQFFRLSLEIRNSDRSSHF